MQIYSSEDVAEEVSVYAAPVSFTIFAAIYPCVVEAFKEFILRPKCRVGEVVARCNMQMSPEDTPVKADAVPVPA